VTVGEKAVVRRRTSVVLDDIAPGAVVAGAPRATCPLSVRERWARACSVRRLRDEPGLDGIARRQVPRPTLVRWGSRSSKNSASPAAKTGLTISAFGRRRGHGLLDNDQETPRPLAGQDGKATRDEIDRGLAGSRTAVRQRNPTVDCANTVAEERTVLVEVLPDLAGGGPP